MKPVVFLILALLLPVVPLHAATLEPVSVDLYTGSADVAGQSTAERERAMPLALAEVLSKLSGLETLDDRPEVRQALERAPDFVVSFHYRNRPVPMPDGTTMDRLQLVVDFAREPVDELVRTLRLPRWQPERNPLVVWFVVEEDLARRIMPIEHQYALAQAIQAAADRGLPTVLPEPDSEGVYPVDVALLWGGYIEELGDELVDDPGEGASSEPVGKMGGTSGEPGSTNVLVIAALRDGPEWNVRMNLDYGGRLWSWRQRGVDLPAILVEGMHSAVTEIAAADSIAAGDLGLWKHEVTVTGIAGSDDYAEVLAYLQGLSLVERVRIVAATPGRLRLALELNALPDYLERSLQQDAVLAPTGTDSEYLLAREPAAGPAASAADDAAADPAVDPAVQPAAEPTSPAGPGEEAQGARNPGADVRENEVEAVAAEPVDE